MHPEARRAGAAVEGEGERAAGLVVHVRTLVVRVEQRRDHLAIRVPDLCITSKSAAARNVCGVVGAEVAHRLRSSGSLVWHCAAADFHLVLRGHGAFSRELALVCGEVVASLAVVAGHRFCVGLCVCVEWCSALRLAARRCPYTSLFCTRPYVYVLLGVYRVRSSLLYIM